MYSSVNSLTTPRVIRDRQSRKSLAQQSQELQNNCTGATARSGEAETSGSQPVLDSTAHPWYQLY